MANLPHRSYMATVSGHAVRMATCESCRTEYAYIVRCEGVGSGTSLLFLDNAGAEARAEEKALEQLQEKLKTEIDAVPCPECGWYQADMVTHIRKAWHGWADFLGLMLIVLGLFGVFVATILAYVTWVSPQARGPSLFGIGMALLGCVGAVIAGFAIQFIRTQIAAGLEPNNYPLNERIALGRARAVLLKDCTEEERAALYEAAAHTK